MTADASAPAAGEGRFTVGEQVRMRCDLGELARGEVVTVTKVITGVRIFDYFVANADGYDRLVVAGEIERR